MLHNGYIGSGTLEPVVEPLTVTENGNYTPPTGVDGYAPVMVQVVGGSSFIEPDYAGLSYGYLSSSGEFYSDTIKEVYNNFYHILPGKYCFFVGETASNRLRIGVFNGKTYADFEYYVQNPHTNAIIYYDNYSFESDSQPQKRMIMDITAECELIVGTSNVNALARGYLVKLQ